MPKVNQKTKTTPLSVPGSHRLCVALSALTLAKRPSESADIIELHAAIQALARVAARSDHSQDQRN